VRDLPKIVVLTVMGLVALSSCRTPTTEEDRTKLQELRSAYANRYEFELEEGLYLRARGVLDKQPDKDEAIQIYRSFWFEGQKLRSTNYVYLNVFDKEGAFQFQVSWDAKKNDFGFSQRPYY
jgi:hypothetical protein